MIKKQLSCENISMITAFYIVSIYARKLNGVTTFTSLIIFDLILVKMYNISKCTDIVDLLF